MPGEDYLGITLKAVQDESLERIFSFLDLLYPHDMIQIIYDRIAGHDANDPLRAHAVELLNNTLDRDILTLVRRILEDRPPRRIEESEIADILKRFSQSEDRWFAMTGYFIVSELELDKQWPELAAISDPFSAMNSAS